MYALFDVGGTHLRVGRVTTDGKMEYEKAPTPREYSEGIVQLGEMVKKIAKTDRVEKVIGGVAGTLDKERKTLLKAYHLSFWAGHALSYELEELVKAPVVLENDAALGALGEAVYGAGRGHHIVAYITIGTGVGGARVVDGKIDMSTYGFEPGHEIIDVDKNMRPEAAHGSLEDYASGTALYTHYGKKAEDITDPAAWEEITKFLAVGIHNAAVFWSPEIIVIGGGRITTPNLLTMIEEHLKSLSNTLPSYPTIAISELGDAATLWGAQALASQK